MGGEGQGRKQIDIFILDNLETRLLALMPEEIRERFKPNKEYFVDLGFVALQRLLSDGFPDIYLQQVRAIEQTVLGLEGLNWCIPQAGDADCFSLSRLKPGIVFTEGMQLPPEPSEAVWAVYQPLLEEVRNLRVLAGLYNRGITSPEQQDGWMCVSPEGEPIKPAIVRG